MGQAKDKERNFEKYVEGLKKNYQLIRQTLIILTISILSQSDKTIISLSFYDKNIIDYVFL